VQGGNTSLCGGAVPLLNDDNEPIVQNGKSIFITRKQLLHVKPHTFLGIND
jgi:hypothetical protein